MSATIYLVRHGRTALNAQGRLRGLADPPLDPTGEQQARAVAAVLSALPVYAVACSPLQRARRTAELIAEAVGTVVSVDDRLNDRDYGPWTSHVRTDVEREWGSVDDAPGVQPVEEVRKRAMKALDGWADIAEQNPPQVVVLITHDAVIRPVLQRIDAAVGIVKAAEGSYQVLRRTGGRWSVVALDEDPARH